MARDYASSSTQKRRKSSSNAQKQSSISVFMTGLMIGVIATMIFFLNKTVIENYAANLLAGKHAHQQPQKAQPAQQKIAPPTFDFYTMLPKMAVPVNGTNTTKIAAKSQAQSPTIDTTGAANDSLKYMIQIASFKNKQDADSLRAQLTLQGFTAKISLVKSGQSSFNRVWVGPFTALSQAQATQKQLISDHHQAFLLKFRG